MGWGIFSGFVKKLLVGEKNSATFALPFGTEELARGVKRGLKQGKASEFCPGDRRAKGLEIAAFFE